MRNLKFSLEGREKKEVQEVRVYKQSKIFQSPKNMAVPLGLLLVGGCMVSTQQH